MKKKATKKIKADCRGIAAVEFALIAPVLFLLLFGIFEFGRVFWVKSSLQYAVEETARRVIVNTGMEEDEIETFILSRINGFDETKVSINISSETDGGVDYINIQADYDFDFIFPFISDEMINVSGRTRIPVSVSE